MIKNNDHITLSALNITLIYVFVTGLGLYWLINNQLISKEKELTNILEELHSEKELTDSLIERIPVMIIIYDILVRRNLGLAWQTIYNSRIYLLGLSFLGYQKFRLFTSYASVAK